KAAPSYAIADRGGFLVEVADATSVNKLLQVRCLGDIPIQVTIPSAYLQNYGLIKAVPTWYTDGELREYLQPEGKPGDAASPSDRVVLTFRPNTERPTKVNLGFTRHEVVEYIEAPPSSKYSRGPLEKLSQNTLLRTTSRRLRMSPPMNHKELQRH
ncbi:hypothetical protein HPB47_012029, partial [Ixodes persulcatus]